MAELCRTYVGTPCEIQEQITEFLEWNPEYELIGRTQRRLVDSNGIDTAYITYQTKEVKADG